MLNNPENINNKLEISNVEQLFPAIEWFTDQISSGFFIYKADGDNELIFVNRGLLQIYACETLEEFKELTGFTFKGIVYKDDYKLVQDEIQKQIEDCTNDNQDYVEYRIVRKDGEIRWVSDYGSLVELPGYGKVYFVFLQDITKRHNFQAEIRLRADAFKGMVEQFNSLADNSLSVIRMNITKGIVEEARGRDLFDKDVAGASIEEIKSIRYNNFITSKDRQQFIDSLNIDKLLSRHYKEEGPASFIGYCRRHSGRAGFVKFSASALVEPTTHDIISFLVETDYDTERVIEILAEKVLFNQYDMVTYLVGDYFGVIFGDAKNIKKGGIFPKEKDGSYTKYLNNQVLPATAEVPQNVKNIEEALSLTRINKELKDNISYSVDVNVKLDGEVYNKRFTYYLVDKDSKTYILLKSDITDVLKEEKKRNDLLSAALEEAERANLAKTAFLSNMSHEIRTPMNAIIGYDTIALNNSDLSPSTRNHLEKIGQSAKHLLGLINNILDMSRIESGRVSIKNEEFLFSKMLEQINTLVQTQCNDKGLSFECRVIGKIDDYYVGDDMKLKQVFINILSNSIKFTQKGKITFEIEKIGSFDGQTSLKFIIKDTGIGMEKSFIPRIFEPFSQESSSSTNKFGSTGLGMAITKNIVEMMKGKIEVDSEKGVGTTFTVSMTLKNSTKKYVASDTIKAHDVKVLVIDDENLDCQHARLVLEEVGIQVDTCMNPDDSFKMIEVQKAKQNPYNLILVDLQMPIMDGLDVARKVREMCGEKVIIIILTAYNWDEILDEALHAGVDGFIAKPLFTSNVLEEFERIIKKKDLNKNHEEEERVNLEGKRVLLAEDMAINAEIIKQILKMRNIVVDYAENGQIALDKFSESKENYYDAILMDVRMPVMDGLKASSEIRELERPDAKTVPIIALTANAFDDDVKKSLQAGMTAHLSKPVEIDQLFKTLERLIGNKN